MEPGAKLGESSTSLLLHEHERLTGLFVENRTMGERRTTLYLTFVAATTPLMAVLMQFAAAQYVSALNV